MTAPRLLKAGLLDPVACDGVKEEDLLADFAAALVTSS